MGVVYKAEDTQLKRTVALKVMLPILGASESARKRFIREAQVAAAIDHDNIVHIYQVGDDHGVPFMAMQFLHGESLNERLKREKRLPIAEVLRIGRETAEGLAAAHERGLIHRDIKPPNLWLEGQRRRVKILDFGVARAVGDDAHLTQTGAIIGTPAYMAPEQAQGKPVDQRCDLFSLGCVLYCISTGQLPFKGSDTFSILTALALENPPPPASLNPAVPKELSDLVMRLLAKEPEERPQSAQLIVRALQEIEQKTAEADAIVVVDVEGEMQAETNGLHRGRITRIEAVHTQPAWFRRKPPPLPCLLGMCGGLLAVAIAGIVLFWPTKRGLVKIETDDPAIEIVFDKNGPTVKGAGKEPISLGAGEHGVHIKRGDFEFDAEKFVLRKGEAVTLKVERLPGRVRVAVDGRVLGEGKLQGGTKCPITAYKNRNGTWRPDGDELVQETTLDDCRLAFGDFKWTDYDFTCEAKKIRGNWDIGVMCHLTGAGYYGLSRGAYGNSCDWIYTRNRLGEWNLYQERVATETDKWYKLGVRIRGGWCQYFFDDHLFRECSASEHPRGMVGLMTWRTAARFRNPRLLDANGKVLLDHWPDLPANDTEWLPSTEPSSQQELYCLKGHRCPITGVAFSPDGRFLLSGSNGNTWTTTGFCVNPPSTIRLWDVKKGTEVSSSVTNPNNPNDCRLPRHLAWISDSSRFVAAIAGGDDAKRQESDVERWSCSGTKLQSQFVYSQIVSGHVVDWQFTPDGRRGLILSSNGGVWEANLEARQFECRIQDQGRNAKCGAIAPNGQFAVLAERDRPLIRIELKTGKEMGRTEQKADDTSCLAFTPDGQRLLTGQADGSICIRNVTDGKLIHRFTGHEGDVRALAISADGKAALSGGQDRTVRLWDLDHLKVVDCFTGHTEAVTTVAFSPDGNLAASGSEDYTVRVWQLATRRPASSTAASDGARGRRAGPHR
jgi:WD40 repeat protein